MVLIWYHIVGSSFLFIRKISKKSFQCARKRYKVFDIQAHQDKFVRTLLDDTKYITQIEICSVYSHNVDDVVLDVWYMEAITKACGLCSHAEIYIWLHFCFTAVSLAICFQSIRFEGSLDFTEQGITKTSSSRIVII